jgi:dTDP-4-dehydrorhamnose reductase
MKVILFGASGMLGSYLVETLSGDFEIFPITRSECDLSNVSLSRLKSLISKEDIIINASASFSSHEQMSLVNFYFPALLAKAQRSIGFEAIHISTDGVFNHLKSYRLETDTPDALDFYGRSKAAGEHPEFSTIRTSIIGESKNGRHLLEWAKSHKNKTIKGFSNHFWNGISCLELCRVIRDIIYNKSFWRGPKHFYSEPTTKLDLLIQMNKVYGLSMSIQSTEYEIPCFRTLGSIYRGGFIRTPLEVQIQELKAFEKFI